MLCRAGYAKTTKHPISVSILSEKAKTEEQDTQHGCGQGKKVKGHRSNSGLVCFGRNIDRFAAVISPEQPRPSSLGYIFCHRRWVHDYDGRLFDIHTVSFTLFFYIRDVVILGLVLSLNFFQFLTSFVPYLSLIFSKPKPVCTLKLAPNGQSC